MFKKHTEKQQANNEKEFLSAYNIDKYERPSVTADVAAFAMRTDESEYYRRDPQSKLSLLLIRRGRHPFLGEWALPGGFLHSDETIEECAVREITEETNITPNSIIPVGIFSEPGRDPRGWIISAAFASIISEENVRAASGDDADDAQWFDVEFTETENAAGLVLRHRDIALTAGLSVSKDKYGLTIYRIEENNGIAFDHAKIIASAMHELRERSKDFNIIFEFLPEKFTLAALQAVQETITHISLQSANFRRKASDHVVETDEYTSGAGHRPAKLYRRKN